jgi:hypothetical protein
MRPNGALGLHVKSADAWPLLWIVQFEGGAFRSRWKDHVTSGCAWAQPSLACAPAFLVVGSSRSARAGSFRPPPARGFPPWGCRPGVDLWGGSLVGLGIWRSRSGSVTELREVPRFVFPKVGAARAAGGAIRLGSRLTTGVKE